MIGCQLLWCFSSLLVCVCVCVCECVRALLCGCNDVLDSFRSVVIGLSGCCYGILGGFKGVAMQLL